MVYAPVQLTQEFRNFDFLSPWEGTEYVLPGEREGGQIMKSTLKPGLSHRIVYTVAERTTVPCTYPDLRLSPPCPRYSPPAS